MKNLLKRFLSLVLVVFIFLYSFNIDVVVDANSVSVPFNVTDNLNVFNQLGNELSNSIPTSLVNGYAVNYAMDLEKISHDLAKASYERLSSSEKEEYKNNYIYYYVKNYSDLAYEASEIISENVKYKNSFVYSGIHSNLSNMSKKVCRSLEEMINQGSLLLDDLDKKIRLQVDTNLINRFLVSNLDLDETLKNNYSFLAENSIIEDMDNSDISKMGYSDLYYSFTNEKNRLDLLYSLTDSMPVEFLKKPISCIVLDIDNPYFYGNEVSNFYAAISDEEIFEYKKIADYYNLRMFFRRHFHMDNYSDEGLDVYYKVFPYGAQNYGNITHVFYLVLDTFNFTNHFTAVDPKENVTYFNLLKNPLRTQDCYMVTHLGGTCRWQHGTIGNPANRLFTFPIPFSLVSKVFELPFENHEDVSKFRQKYLLYSYDIPNKPVNYVISIGDLLSGKLDKAEPATIELVADLPVINTTSLPVSYDFPTSEEIQKEKEKEKQSQKEKDKNKQLVIDFTKLKEAIKEVFTFLFVPSDTFFQDEINKMKTTLETKVDTKYIDKIFGGFKNVGTYPFNDFYIDFGQNHIKVFDFSFVKNSLSSLKTFTDPLFWLLLMLFVFNETHFLIRGTYPLKLKRSVKK